MTRNPGVVALLAGLVLSSAVALWAAYRVAFDAPFYFDTYSHLVSKTNLHMVEFSTRSFADATHFGPGGPLYRPLSNLTLAFTHYFFGPSPRAYRVGNLVIHSASALALWFLFLSVRQAPRLRGRHVPDARAAWTCAFAVALWTLHPVQTNVVTYVVQRMASLAGLFSFLSVGFYLRARSRPAGWSWGHGGLAFVCLALGVASKENAATVPLLWAAGEWSLLRCPSRAALRRCFLTLGLLVLVGAVAAAGWKGSLLWTDLGSLFSLRPFTPWERLLTEMRLQFQYLTVLLVPDPRLLTLDAEVQISRGLWDPPSTAAAAAAMVLAVGLAIKVRRARPLLSFGVLWYLAAQALEGTVLPLELYFEHRLYVPSVFVFYGLSYGLTTLFRRPEKAWKAASVLGSLLVLATYSLGTYSRNRTWSDPVAFWEDAIRKAPGKARIYTDFCHYLVSVEKLAEAQEYCEVGLSLGADPVPAHVNLATIAYKRGAGERAREHLLAALAVPTPENLRDDKWLANRGLATLLIAEGELEAAEARLELARRAQPGDPETWSLLGGIALLRGDTELAEERLGKALRYGPNHARAWNNLGVLRFQRGEARGAVEAFSRASELDPTAPEYVGNLRKAQRLLAGTGADAP